MSFYKAEEWKELPGNYFVSNMGRIRNKKGQILKDARHPGGYRSININRKTHVVHRLVAAAFIGPLTKDLVVNHKNGNKTDNRAENLECITQKENRAHAILIGLHDGKPARKLDKKQVLRIKEIVAGAPLTNRELGCLFGVHHAQISKIRLGECWNDVF